VLGTAAAGSGFTPFSIASAEVNEQSSGEVTWIEQWDEANQLPYW
jgi:hypothetical protein